MLQEEYQMKLLKRARNKKRQKLFKSKSNILFNLNVLREQLSKDDCHTLITITDNIEEKHFIKQKENLITKFNSLKNTTDHLYIPIETFASIIKEGIVNLREAELDESKIELLNLGPKFVPTEKRKRSYMDII